MADFPKFPIKVNDNYTCQGIDADGKFVAFDDLLSLQGDGGRVAFGPGNDGAPPFGRIEIRPDGMWVRAETDEEYRAWTAEHFPELAATGESEGTDV